MANATRVRDADKFQLLAGATYAGGQMIQLPSGEPCYLDSTDPLVSGAYSDSFATASKATVVKTVGVVMLAGQETYWDRSALSLTYRKNNGRDFRAGTLYADAASADITAGLDIGKRPRHDIDMSRDLFMSAVTGTQALGAMGVYHRGGGVKLIMSVTNEVQKVDLISRDGFAPGAKWIAEFLIAVPSFGAGASPKLNIGVANATGADATTATESAYIHADGFSGKIWASSKDPITTVAATDTTLTYTAGSAVASRVHVLIDGRNLASVKFYINGVQALSATTFRLDNATGPLFLIAHLAKVSATVDVYEVDVERARVWYSEQ